MLKDKDKNECVATVEGYWQEKTEVRVETPYQCQFLYRLSHIDWLGVERQPTWRWKQYVSPTNYMAL